MIDKEIPVLDHGKIIVKDFMGNDDSVVQAARVSYGNGTKTKRQDEKLINYLISHDHVSPLEQCEIKLLMKMPIFVDRQWSKHNGKKNEVSARYSVLPTEQYVPEIDQICKQSTDNKQGRSNSLELDYTPEQKQQIRDSMIIQNQQANETYNNLIDLGFTRELARCVLPVSTYTEYYWKTNLRDMCFLLKARMHPTAQYEIRMYANAIAKHIMPLWVPVTWQAFETHKIRESIDD